MYLPWLPDVAIVFVGTLAFSCGISARLGELLIGRMEEDEIFKNIAREAVCDTAVVQRSSV